MLIFDQNDLRVKRQTAHIQIGQANRYYSEYSAIIHFVFSHSPATTREFRVRSRAFWKCSESASTNVSSINSAIKMGKVKSVILPSILPSNFPPEK